MMVGRVEAVLVADQSDSLISSRRKKIYCSINHGIEDDRHASWCRRVDGQEIVNLRQFSAISLEELKDISLAMNLPDVIPYGLLGENLVISGIPQFTQLPVGSLIFFRRGDEKRNAVLFVWQENKPCICPGKAIQSFYQQPSIPATSFPKAAINRRGVVGGVYCSGVICEGDEVVVEH